jgi:hypothetical protein
MASFSDRARILKRELHGSSAALQSVLSEAAVSALCRAVGHRWRDCFWRPAVVILTFVRQILLTQCSCRQSVAFTIADPALRDERDVDDDPSAYSQARQLLPLPLFERLASALAKSLEQPDRRWRGHRVRIVDGSSVSMPDTPALQAAFPQPDSQRKGCGFPVARLLAVFCWHSGAWLRMQIDSLHIGELALFRRVLELFEPDDVVVADRLFGTYTDLCLLRSRAAHAVCRVNRARKVDLRRGKSLGPNDRLMIWSRPRAAELALAPELHEPLPETLTVRVLRLTVPCRRAWRSKTIELVTTLLDAERYPPEALAELYRQRWLAELDLRSLKTTLGMDVLRCKSPAMVRKELLVFQIAYNLIRTLMLQAGRLHQVDPQRLSFAGTRQRLLAFLPHWPAAARHAASRNDGRAGSPPRLTPRRRRMIESLLQSIADDPLPERPPRHEPRAVKRRRKSFPYLVHPRAKARCLANYDKRR